MVNTPLAFAYPCLYILISGFLLLLPYGICYLRIHYITPVFQLLPFALQKGRVGKCLIRCEDLESKQQPAGQPVQRHRLNYQKE
jgi:hypothetical protein